MNITHNTMKIVLVRFSTNELQRMSRGHQIDWPKIELDQLKGATNIQFKGPIQNTR